jgi:hypothetical protein
LDLYFNGVTLAFPEFELRPECIGGISNGCDFPYRKPGGQLPGYHMTIGNPAAIGDVRAVSYLSMLFGTELSRPPLVRTDTETQASLNLNLVTAGFGSNLKTRDCFENGANALAKFDFDNNRLQIGGEEVQFLPGYAYGVILKINPTQFPQRTWIACAGMDQWGTSASAWFLANKWRTLYSFEAAGGRIEARPFAALIRARPGQDESAEVLRVYAS